MASQDERLYTCMCALCKCDLGQLYQTTSEHCIAYRRRLWQGSSRSFVEHVNSSCIFNRIMQNKNQWGPNLYTAGAQWCRHPASVNNWVLLADLAEATSTSFVFQGSFTSPSPWICLLSWKSSSSCSSLLLHAWCLDHQIISHPYILLPPFKQHAVAH
jgi:hypothetical protein